MVKDGVMGPSLKDIEKLPFTVLDEKYLILKTLGDGRYARYETKLLTES